MKQLIFFAFMVFAVSFSTIANAQINVSPWQMHRGIDKEPISFRFGSGDPFSKMNIPPSDHSGWKNAPTQGGKVHFAESSKLNTCKTELDFTYFQTIVNVPRGAKIQEFNVSFDKADDGARIYFFNAKHPNGHFNADADLGSGSTAVSQVNLVDLVAEGENKVVIVQYDNCRVLNNVQGINIKVDGKIIKTEEKPACGQFRMIGHWTFEGSSPLKDAKGNFGDLQLVGSAKVTNGALDVGNNAWAKGTGYNGKALKEKTLIAWVRMDDLNVRAGSVLTIDKTDKDEFDGIVYAEKEAGKWMSGSNMFSRTDNVRPGFKETKTGESVMMAISYGEKNGKANVKLYRNGDLIGDYTKGSLAEFGKTSEVLFGTRHTFRNSPRSFVDAKIDEARIYAGVLCQKDIKDLMKKEPTFDPDACYRLTCKFQGEGKSLATTKSGNRTIPQLAKTANSTSQIWKVTPLKGGYYRLTNVGLGEGYSLDIINVGTAQKSNKPQMYKSAGYTGQQWKITSLKDGYFRLTTKFTGEGKSLDVINDSKDIDLELRNSTMQTGQQWKFTKVDCSPAVVATGPLMEVAKGKTARQSSTKYDARGAASNAIDGNKNGNWAWSNNSITHTNDEKDPWWEVDLGGVYDISKIEIWNRRDCCWDRLKNFHIMVSERPISNNSTTQNQFIGGAHSFTSGDHPSMILEGNKRGRYVRIFLKADNMPLSLTEVEVHGRRVN
ncbi:MAG: RICIN domain-containing protein [Bacteroidota bacterium]